MWPPGLDTIVPHSVHLSPAEQRGPECSGTLGERLLVGGDRELGRMDISAVPTRTDKTMSPRCCGVEDPYHCWHDVRLTSISHLRYRVPGPRAGGRGRSRGIMQ